MRSREFRYFLEVARTGSVSEASVQLRLSASTISRQIAKLEDELGIELFERQPRGMIPTPAGEALFKRLLRLTLEADEALAEVRAMRGPTRGTIRIGCYEGFAIDGLARVMSTFRNEFPAVHFDVWVGSSSTICEKVSNGCVDVGITYSFSPPAGVLTHRVVERPMFAMVPIGHRLCGCAKLVLADLVGEALSMPDPSRTQRTLINSALAANGLFVEPVLTTNSVATMISFALASKSIVLSSTPESSHVTSAQAKMIPIEDPALAMSSLQIVSMSGRRLPFIIVEFIQGLSAAIMDFDSAAGE